MFRSRSSQKSDVGTSPKRVISDSSSRYTSLSGQWALCNTPTAGFGKSCYYFVLRSFTPYRVRIVAIHGGCVNSASPNGNSRQNQVFGGSGPPNTPQIWPKFLANPKSRGNNTMRTFFDVSRLPEFESELSLAQKNLVWGELKYVHFGCPQLYVETFAPTVRMATLRTILPIAALEDLEIIAIDISQAFNNGDLDMKIYMEQPESFKSGRPGNILHLIKGLYGLKQAGHLWNKKLHAALLSLGFKRLQPLSMAMPKVLSGLLFLSMWMTLPWLAPSCSEIEKVISELSQHFKLLHVE